MTKEEKDEIKKLFPLTITATQEMIDNGKPIGDQLLQSIIPEKFWGDIFWGLSLGSISSILIATEKEITYKNKKTMAAFYLDRNQITEPQEITFRLR